MVFAPVQELLIVDEDFSGLVNDPNLFHKLSVCPLSCAIDTAVPRYCRRFPLGEAQTSLVCACRAPDLVSMAIKYQATRVIPFCPKPWLI
jgi:hypothetical protein